MLTWAPGRSCRKVAAAASTLGTAMAMWFKRLRDAGDCDDDDASGEVVVVVEKRAVVSPPPPRREMRLKKSW